MTQNKRLLFILINPKTITNFYDILFKQLSKKYEIHILTSKDKSFKNVQDLNYQFHFFKIPTQNSFDFLQMNYLIFKTIKKVNPDLVIGFTIRNIIFGNLMSHFLKKPTITPIVGLGPLFENKSTAFKIAKKLLPIALKNTSHIFFYNDEDMNLFINKKIIQNNSYSRIIGNGVNIDKFQPQSTKINKNIKFLLISRLLYDKGFQEYYDAAKIVLKKYPNVKFQILGCFYNNNVQSNTISKKTVQNWVKEGVIDYLGCDTDTVSQIAKCDCVVLPSYREGLSNVLMEGGSMAKPLLASNVPGCKELIIDNYNGYTFKVKSPKDLANACFKIIELPINKRESMGLNSRKLMIKKYNRINSTKEFIKKIDFVINN